jgi:hypothetical protein
MATSLSAATSNPFESISLPSWFWPISIMIVLMFGIWWFSTNAYEASRGRSSDSPTAWIIGGIACGLGTIATFVWAYIAVSDAFGAGAAKLLPAVLIGGVILAWLSTSTSVRRR